MLVSSIKMHMKKPHVNGAVQVVFMCIPMPRKLNKLKMAHAYVPYV